jgi:hypothetical protein
MTDALVLGGKRFELTLREQETGGRAWQWMLAAPGELLMSGEEPTADEALRAACRAGSIWATLTPAA